MSVDLATLMGGSRYLQSTGGAETLEVVRGNRCVTLDYSASGTLELPDVTDEKLVPIGAQLMLINNGSAAVIVQERGSTRAFLFSLEAAIVTAQRDRDGNRFWSVIEKTVNASAPQVGFQYYVSNTGDDANDGLSPGQAWRTIAKVNGETFQPGEQILFERGGTWSEELTIPSSGASGNPIVIGDYGAGSLPTIDGGGTRTTAINATDKDYITVRNLRLIGWVQRGIQNTAGDGWLIDGLTVSSTEDTRPSHAIRLVGTSSKIAGGTIQNCTVGQMGSTPNASIFFQGILCQGVDNVVVRNNVVSTVNASAITLDRVVGLANNENCRVTGNTLSNNYSGLHLFYTNNTLVERNVITGGSGLGIGVAFTSNDNEIRLNVIYEIAANTLNSLWNGFDISNDSQNGKVYHNTVSSVSRHSFVFAEDGGVDLRGWDLRNNIFDSRRNDGTGIPGGEPDERAIAIGIRNSSQYTENNNLVPPDARGFVASWTATTGSGTLYDLADYQTNSGQGAGDSTGDPRYVDEASGDFHLASGSAAAGLGDSAVPVQFDKDGVPFRNPPAAGAFESLV